MKQTSNILYSFPIPKIKKAKRTRHLFQVKNFRHARGLWNTCIPYCLYIYEILSMCDISILRVSCTSTVPASPTCTSRNSSRKTSRLSRLRTFDFIFPVDVAFDTSSSIWVPDLRRLQPLGLQSREWFYTSVHKNPTAHPISNQFRLQFSELNSHVIMSSAHLSAPFQQILTITGYGYIITWAICGLTSSKQVNWFRKLCGNIVSVKWRCWEFGSQVWWVQSKLCANEIDSYWIAPHNLLQIA